MISFIKMKNNRYNNIIIYSIIIPLFIGFIYLNYRGGLKEKEIYKIVDRSWNIDGVIIDIRTSNYINNRGTIITTSDNQKFIFPWARNFNYKRSMLSEFVQKGDSILKKKNSDSIYIYRENEVFYFILEERIQKDE